MLVHEGKERAIKRVVDGRMKEFNLVKELDLIEPQEQQQQAVVHITQIGKDARGNAFGSESSVRNHDHSVQDF